MRQITVGFSKPRNKIFPIYSWLIRLFEGTKFSHVYVKHQTKHGIDIIYQASGTSVNFMNGDIFKSNNEPVREFTFNITDQAFDRYMSFALKNAGKPYGVLQVFGIMAVMVFKLQKNPFPSGSANYVCSELVAEILFELGKHHSDRQYLDVITPKEIYKHCLAYEVVQ